MTTPKTVFTLALTLTFALFAPACGDKDGALDDSECANVDADGDGVLACADCDDDDPNVKPGWPEVCDTKDNNCDGAVDEGVDLALYTDADGDGFGGAGVTARACEPLPGLVEIAGDCDDADAATHPDATDTCDGADNNCDGLVDEGEGATWYVDGDGDGFGGEDTVQSCEPPSGYVATPGDCDDGAASVNPEAAEVCADQIDNDCDGEATGCRYTGEQSDPPVHLYSDSRGGAAAFFGQSLVRLSREGLGDRLVISAPASSRTVSYGGEVWAMEGELRDGDGTTDVGTLALYGTNKNEQIGASLGRVGDVNGDGVEELLIRLVYGDDREQALAVVLVNGAKTGVRPITEGSLLLHGIGDPLGTISGLGNGMDGLGDHDADGVADLILSDGNYTNSAGLYTGKVWVTPANQTGEQAIYDVAVATVEGAPSQPIGVSAEWVGDINGDGFDDALIGSPSFTEDGEAQRGAVLLFEGPLVGSYTSEDAAVTLVGNDAGDYFGYRAGRVGDYDGDGYDDVLAAAPGDSTAVSGGGAVGIWLSPITETTFSSADLLIYGTTKNNSFKLALEAGDNDGDGNTDLLIGDPAASSARLTTNGALGLLYGPTTGSLLIDDLSARFVGDDDGEAIGNYATFVDLDGDGADEIAFADRDGGFEAVAVFPGLGL